MTALQRNISDVKEAARNEVVRITEQGGSAFVFGSEEAFEKRIAAEREDAAYEARLLEAVGRGVADIGAGRYAESVDDVFRKAESMRSRYA
ncbi:MAG TPA: hypothetical protein DCP91_11705 [Eggerthellaceae bacterium]|nr:hypothetical protein [Eggerthellaceae bacterium]